MSRGRVSLAPSACRNVGNPRRPLYLCRFGSATESVSRPSPKWARATPQGFATFTRRLDRVARALRGEPRADCGDSARPKRGPATLKVGTATGRHARTRRTCLDSQALTARRSPFTRGRSVSAPNLVEVLCGGFVMSGSWVVSALTARVGLGPHGAGRERALRLGPLRRPLRRAVGARLPALVGRR
jgi:hypothetical protein